MVWLGEDFSVEGLSAYADAPSYVPDELSSGTREQLHLILRLALGTSYARAYGPVMMVLDDALLPTDSDRHDRLMSLKTPHGSCRSLS